MVLALISTVLIAAVPAITAGLNGARARGAAFYVSSRFALVRTLAVQRHANVALKFELEGDGIRVRTILDSNGNGVRAAEIDAGVDLPILPDDRIDRQFGGVRYGFVEGATLIDGTPVSPGDDPVRFGKSDMLVFTPSGTATAGTVYLRGRDRSQYAVVVLGATGRTRIVRFDLRTGKWVDR
ncbi:MAG TPA: GspH/FimT family pseudopilin [Vicinamibacterales bacterium]|nr:GspH/FimT family pseudopilin [Vicinamibacterales bacterium]